MLVDTRTKFDALRERLRSHRARRWPEPLGLDFETFGPSFEHGGKSKPDFTRHRIAGYSLAFLDGFRTYMPVRHPEQLVPSVEAGPPRYEPCDARWRLLRLLLAQPGLTLWAHNAKTERALLINEGIPIIARLWCSEMAAYVAGFEHEAGSLALKPLARHYFDHQGPDFNAVARGRASNAIPQAELAPYAADDAWWTLQVGQLALRRCTELDSLEHFELEQRCVAVTEHMERTGVPINRERLLADAERCEREAAELSERFTALTTTTVMLPAKVRRPKPCERCDGTGWMVEPGRNEYEVDSKLPCVGTGRKVCVAGVAHHKNGRAVEHTVEELQPTVRGARVGSDADVSRWLFQELRWWPTAKDHPKVEYGHSVKEEYIRRFAALPGDAGEACRVRLRHQALRKYASTYTRSLVSLADQAGDGRLHTSYKQDGTDTTRYSSSMPNQSNLPRSERQQLPWMQGMPDIRASFIAEPGWEISILDFSQLEMRIMAHYSRDPALMECYGGSSPVDVHERTRLGMEARSSSGMKVQRGDAKITNFCLDPATLVLTPDLRWKPAGALGVGDPVVGFDETLGFWCRYRNTEVEATKTLTQRCCRVVTTHGESIVSEHHGWVVCGADVVGGRPVRGWRKTLELQPGDELAHFAKPWGELRTYEDGWLAGMFDGEGSSRRGTVQVAQNEGPLLDRLRKALTDRGFQYDDRKARSGPCHSLIVRGDAEGYRLLGSLRPQRLLAQTSLAGCRPVKTHHLNPTVLAVEPLGMREVVALQTGTHTLVSDGFLTHNSTIYAISAQSLAKKLSMGTNDWESYTPRVAQGFIDGFFDTYPKVRSYHERAVDYAKERNRATSLTGFKRPITAWNERKRDEDTGRSYSLYGYCCRQAINTPIQASAGGILKRALVALYERWVERGILGRVVNIVGQTYDEVIVTNRFGAGEEVRADMKRIMEGAAPELRVPLSVDGGHGPSWSEAK